MTSHPPGTSLAFPQTTHPNAPSFNLHKTATTAQTLLNHINKVNQFVSIQAYPSARKTKGTQQ
jgi:hypothetical protein